MLQGTGSGVGKSLLTAAFCRLARRRGIAVVPFKGQNMSNNAAVTADGGEIGRAQALQAQAAGLDPHVDMNPILLKPLADTRSEVVRLGRTDRGATELPWRERKSHLWPVVTERTGVPVLGVVPWIEHNLPEEDGGPALAAGPADAPAIAVAAYPRASNLDDLDPLRREPGVRLRWVRRAGDLAALAAPPGLAAIILPGSRNTLDDLRWMRRTGLADAIRALATDGIPVAGLCAGYQIMGRRITDPAGIEGGGGEPGLGILDVRTELAPTKETRRTYARIAAGAPRWLAVEEGEGVAGYEIHHGRTRAATGLRPWLADGPRALGHADGAHWGCYLHGALGNDNLRTAWLRSLGLRPDAAGWSGAVDGELDRLADTVEPCLDVDAVLEDALQRTAGLTR